MKSVDKMRLVSSLARSFSLGTIKVALICATEIANVIRLETIYAKLTIFESYWTGHATVFKTIFIEIGSCNIRNQPELPLKFTPVSLF